MVLALIFALASALLIETVENNLINKTQMKLKIATLTILASLSMWANAQPGNDGTSSSGNIGNSSSNSGSYTNMGNGSDSVNHNIPSGSSNYNVGSTGSGENYTNLNGSASSNGYANSSPVINNKAGHFYTNGNYNGSVYNNSTNRWPGQNTNHWSDPNTNSWSGVNTNSSVDEDMGGSTTNHHHWWQFWRH